MKWYKSLWFKTIIVMLCFLPIVIMGTLFLLWCLKSEAYDIEKSNWLNAIFAWISAISAMFIGLVAVWQNERFKQESDKNTMRSEQEARKYQNELLEVNKRIMRLEESKEYAYVTFIQCPGHVVNNDVCGTQEIEYTQAKKYAAFIANDRNNLTNKGTMFELFLTNQTDVPIRYIEFIETIISYDDFTSGKRIPVAKYGKGGYISSPIISKSEIAQLLLVTDGIYDLVANKPPKSEIVIKFIIQVTSIFNRTSTQVFLLRLQANNVYFVQSTPTVFWNYCNEFNSNIEKESEDN